MPRRCLPDTIKQGLGEQARMHRREGKGPLSPPGEHRKLYRAREAAVPGAGADSEWGML